MMVMLCPICHHEIKATPGEWRLPPWCPTCGSAVTAGPENVQFQSVLDRVGPPPALPLAQAPYAPPPPDRDSPGVAAAPASAPPHGSVYFAAVDASIWKGRKREHYRLYPTSHDLLIVRSAGGMTERDRVEATGLALGGLFYGRVVADQMLDEMPQSRLLTRAEWLDAADEPQLRMYAGEEGGGWVIRPEEVHWMRLDPPTIWRQFLGSLPHDALLTIDDRQFGQLKLALPTFTDARRAGQWLPRLFSHACQVNLNWNA